MFRCAPIPTLVVLHLAFHPLPAGAGNPPAPFGSQRGFCFPDSGGICDCSLSSIRNLVATPDGSVATTFTIVGTAGPLVGANVEVCYPPAIQSAACWCADSPLPPYTATTNSEGQVSFRIKGGNCIDPLVSLEEIGVLVNGVYARGVGQVSPDVVPSVSGSCEVTLADAVHFTADLGTGNYNFCHDLNSDLAVGLTDAVMLTPLVSLAVGCSP